MWYVTDYQSVGLISLKLSTATSTGGKSLLLPTPFAIKMALLDVILRDVGEVRGKRLWPQLRDAEIALCGPQRIAVSNAFVKILKPAKNGPVADSDTGLVRPMVNSIAFREYVHWQGELAIGFRPAGASAAPWHKWMTMISYFGKRGGFVQAVKTAQETEELTDVFTRIVGLGTHFSLDGTVQIMDDCGPKVTFEQVNIYSSKNMKLGKDRVLHHVILPYRLTRSSRGYSLYERID